MHLTHWETLEFSPPFLYLALAGGDIGEALQMVAFELLKPDYANLERLPARGKDGGIDLHEDRPGERAVVQCKVIGEPGLEAVLKSWKLFAETLERNVRDPKGPPAGQGQYQPWYRTDLPIREFVWCVSSPLNNVNQRDQAQQAIVRFFDQLAAKYAHLSHLAGMDVKVLDWHRLRERLESRPQVALRWFPALRQHNLKPLEKVSDTGTFRSYLNSDRLAYYSRAEHLRIHPKPGHADIHTEEDLLHLLEVDAFSGLILAGVGGVGKSRMTLELGHLAEARGWLVLKVANRSLELGDLTEYARLFSKPGIRTLLLIDYVELQANFAGLVETILELNNTYDLSIRYIANCRTNFYFQQGLDEIPDHLMIDLSPTNQGQAWFQSYKERTVRHILESADLGDDETLTQTCQGLPVLATFLAYLNNAGRKADLEELRKEENFASWILRRLQLTFGKTSIDRELAALISLFPWRGPLPSATDHKSIRDLFERLVMDGWIEQEAEEPGTWAVIHDVLADQILISYLRRISKIQQAFVEDLFNFAISFGQLHSALIALRRIAGSSELGSIDWKTLLDAQFAVAPQAWKHVRDVVLYWPSLRLDDISSFLERHPDVWEGADETTEFQLGLGWHLKTAVKSALPGQHHKLNTALLIRLKSIVRLASKINYVLTWSLRYAPGEFQEAALAWIAAHPLRFQTHYLLVACLDTGTLPDLLAAQVLAWSNAFEQDAHFCFVASAWLRAGGDHGVIRDSIGKWLEQHKTSLEAEFVYKAWLDATGECDFVRASLAQWLEQHQTSLEAEFVYKAWLDSKGDCEFIRAPIAQWLEQHKTSEEARFVYYAWLGSTGECDFVRAPIAKWLEQHKTSLEAEFVYYAWLGAAGECDFVRAPISQWLEQHKTSLEASFVYQAWLDSKGDCDFVRASIAQWLEQHKTSEEARFVYYAWLGSTGECDFVRAPIAKWLEQHKSSSDASFVCKAWLAAGGDFETVREVSIDWLRRNKDDAEAVFLLKYLSKQKRLPNETIQDILHWCRKHADNPDAIWRLSSLNSQLAKTDTKVAAILAAESVIDVYLSGPEGISDRVAEQITNTLAFVTKYDKHVEPQVRERLELLHLRWFLHPCSFTQRHSHPTSQQLGFLLKLIGHLKAGKLDLHRDRARFEAFFRWMNTWSVENKERIRKQLGYLRKKFPQGRLIWSLVRLGPLPAPTPSPGHHLAPGPPGNGRSP